MCRTSRPSRRLIAIDIENVVGGGVATVDQARWALHLLAPYYRPADHVVIGTSEFSLLATRIAWGTGPRYVVRSGRDGADIALAAVLSTENVAARFDSVMLVSGDHYFTAVVAELAARLPITVLSHPSCAAGSLVNAATSFLPLQQNLVGCQREGTTSDLVLP